MKRIGKVLLAFALVAAMLIPMALTTRAEAKSDFGRDDIVGDLQNSDLDEYGKLKEKKKQDEGEHVGDWIKDHTVPGNLNNDPATNDSGGSTMPGVNPGKNGNPADQVTPPRETKDWEDYAIVYMHYYNEEYNRHFVFSAHVEKCVAVHYIYPDGHVETADPAEEYKFSTIIPEQIVSGIDSLEIKSFSQTYDPVKNKKEDSFTLEFKWKEAISDPFPYDEPTFPEGEPVDNPLNGEGFGENADDDIDHTGNVPTEITVSDSMKVKIETLLCQSDTVLINS